MNFDELPSQFSCGSYSSASFAFSRLKLGNEYRYQLNGKGSTPSEVLGIDYKTTIKPALASFEESLKKGSMEKLEELITLRQSSAENASKIESKRNRLASLNSRIDEVRKMLSFNITVANDLIAFSFYCKWNTIHFNISLKVEVVQGKKSEESNGKNDRAVSINEQSL